MPFSDSIIGVNYAARLFSLDSMGILVSQKVEEDTLISIYRSSDGEKWTLCDTIVQPWDTQFFSIAGFEKAENRLLFMHQHEPMRDFGADCSEDSTINFPFGFVQLFNSNNRWLIKKGKKMLVRDANEIVGTLDGGQNWHSKALPPPSNCPYDCWIVEWKNRFFYVKHDLRIFEIKDFGLDLELVLYGFSGFDGQVGVKNGLWFATDFDQPTQWLMSNDPAKKWLRMKGPILPFAEQFEFFGDSLDLIFLKSGNIYRTDGKAFLDKIEAVTATNEPTKSDFLSFKISPNPSSDNFEIYFEKGLSERANLLIMNELGKIVFEKRLEKGQFEQLEIDLADLPSGLYFLKMENEKRQSAVQKIAIVRL